MCGIAGTIGFDAASGPSRDHVSRMISAIAHRGPDSDGIYNVASGDADVWLGHRRLAIVDLSPAGHQPMVHPRSGDVLVFNGEIYNHLELREGELSRFDIQWRGHSDTETLLHSLACLGLERTLAVVRGMFAFAWLNRESDRLYLARDAAGEKPLYYGASGSVSVFASELKAIHAVKDVFPLEVSRDAVAAYFLHNFVPAPLSIYKGVFKLPPGSWTSLCLRKGQWTLANRYWRAPASLGTRLETSGTDLDAQLRKTISQQLIADVPVGCFLSGGYDSSLVTAVAASVSSVPVRTFSIGFSNPKYDEAPYAKEVARHLGTEHHEYYVEDEDVRALVPGLAKIWDEPFADSSQIPTLILAGFAKSRVTVCLSGDGGDELFGGYQRHRRFAQLWPRVAATPDWCLRASQRAAHLTSSLVDGHPSMRRLAQLLHRGAPFLDKSGGAEAFYLKFLNGVNIAPERVEAVHGYRKNVGDGSEVRRGLRGAAQWMDQESYLPDDILVKVDRASMAHSLEVRVPFLDRDVMSYSWALSDEELFDDDLGGKAPIKRLAHHYLPREIMERPKRGFAVPMGDWLLGPLRGWAEEMVGVVEARPDLVDPYFVNATWTGFKHGRSWLAQHVWSVLMLGAWLAND